MTFSLLDHAGNSAKHKTHFDILRIIATVLVILNHLPIYRYYENAEGISQFFWTCFTMLIRCNVPIFFMISGALLIGREESIRTILKKRVLRIVVVVILFEYFVYVANAISNQRYADICVNPFVFLKMVLAGSVYQTYPYWYLYAYLGMLLLLPFLSAICDKMGRQEFDILLGLHFLIYTLIPLANFALHMLSYEELIISNWFSIPLAVESAFFYPILGNYLEHKAEKLSIHCSIMLISIGIVVPSVLEIVEGSIYGFSEKYMQFGDYMVAFGLFTACKVFCQAKQCDNIFLRRIASLCFGIYLLDPVLKQLFMGHFEFWIMQHEKVLDLSVCWTLTSVVIGGTITWIMKKIPWLQKLF